MRREIPQFSLAKCYVRAVERPAPHLRFTAAPASAIEALGAEWWARCQAHRCASGRADADERELLLAALLGAAEIDATAPAGSVGGAGGPRDAGRRALSLEHRRVLAAAAARWGGRVGSPSLAVEQLVQLRQLVVHDAGERAVGRLVDLAMVQACRGATDELQRAAFSDPLTGCANRRAFERDLERELARCARAELDLTVVAVDLDGLKDVNDSAGHAAGDRTLVLLVDTMRRALRSMDGVYRLGGDEFGLILPDTSPDDAAVVMTRALRMGAPEFSWGAASFLATGCADAAGLLAVADTELYAQRRLRRPSLRGGRSAVAGRALGGDFVEPVGAMATIRRPDPEPPTAPPAARPTRRSRLRRGSGGARRA